MWRGKPASLPHQLWCSALPLPTGNDKHHFQPRLTGTLAAKPTETQSMSVCVCVIVCKRKREGAITRIFFVGFHVSRHVWVLVCTSLAHVCVRTSISQTNLELMCAIVFLCTLANFPSSQMKLSFESFYIMSHAVLAGAVCHNGSRWCKMWPSCQEPAKYISLRELFEPLHVKPSS